MSGQVSFTSTQADWVAANRMWYGQSTSRRVLKWLGGASFVLAIGALSFDVFGREMRVAAALADSAPMIFFGVLVAGAPLLTGALIPRQVRKQFAQRPSMADETRFAWDDDGLEGSGRGGTTVQPWRELHRQLRDDRSFVFLPTDRLLLLIPRRVLSQEQAADLAATADRNGPKLG